MDTSSARRLGLAATLHCLTGCAIGEVLGMVIGTAAGWTDLATVVLSVALAFFFGYLLTISPLLRQGLGLRNAARIALAADTVSIAVMEVVDNGVMLAVPGAMGAGLANGVFWASLAFSLAVAFAVTWPVNVWLVRRGRGHAVVHGHHGGHRTPADAGGRHEHHAAQVPDAAPSPDVVPSPDAVARRAGSHA